jgi:hypothetical protein
MRTILLASVAAVAAAAARGDDKKDAPKFPASLKGEWRIGSGTDGKGFFTSSAADLVLRIGDGTAEWRAIPKFAERPGKAALTADGKGNEGTLELKVGDQVHKGLYRLTEYKDAKVTMLDILLGPAGGAAPKAFPKDPLKLPEDAVFKLQCQRAD